MCNNHNNNNNNVNNNIRNINICPILPISIHTVEPERKRNVLANNYTTNYWYDYHDYTTITMIIIWLNRLYWFLIPPVTWTFYLLFFYWERAQVDITCYMPKVFADIFWSDCLEFHSIRPSGGDATTATMQKCDKIFYFPASSRAIWSNARTVISWHFREVLHAEIPRMG